MSYFGSLSVPPAFTAPMRVKRKMPPDRSMRF